MHYRSVYDLNAAIARNAHRLPNDIDLVVGIPRSGLLAANLLSLLTNLPLADLDGYLERRITSAGKTKNQAGLQTDFAQIRKVLILDDSANSGTAMLEARKRLEEASFGHTFVYAVVYGVRPDHEYCDLIFEVLPQPRVFQWNLMHHVVLEEACVDIDGVLCHDPSEDENDDGERYLDFLLSVSPLYRPTRRIGTLVTSRLEKYREQTEMWLATQGVKYDKLVMLDLPNKAERQRLAAHGSFKASYYKSSNAPLFIESELNQARHIAHASRKPVLCLETHTLIDAADVLDGVEVVGRNNKAAIYRPPLTKRVKKALKASIGDAHYDRLKRLRSRLSL